ncbi:hypothetical protein EIP86_002477 [Pleurotus ostreatoroseus]|nr:hypothetical protein EIP86_002477 [Pleurotus ostreatoroseus]
MYFTLMLWFPALIIWVPIVAGQSSAASVDIIPGNTSTTYSNAQFTSQATLFDGPKVQPINDTTADWWYFDVVSSDLNYTLVITFFAATHDSLWPATAELDSAVYMLFVLTLPDGTILAANEVGQDLAVVTIDNGSSGVLGGTSNYWVASPDMSEYNVFVDVPELAVTGNISFRSTSPAHYPCAPATASPGQRLYLGSTPTIGWLNAMPDANATVNLNINGTSLQFSGAGYHDKNWASQPVHTTASAWYWGHARLGPFSIVWFDFVSPDGSELVSSYVAKEGKILSSTCANATVRPVGTNAVFPPTANASLSEPPSYNVTMEIEDEGTLIMQLVPTQVILSIPGTVWRWSGEILGGFGNGTTWHGVALYEQFTFDSSL